MWSTAQPKKFVHNRIKCRLPNGLACGASSRVWWSVASGTITLRTNPGQGVQHPVVAPFPRVHPGANSLLWRAEGGGGRLAAKHQSQKREIGLYVVRPTHQHEWSGTTAVYRSHCKVQGCQDLQCGHDLTAPKPIANTTLTVSHHLSSRPQPRFDRTSMPVYPWLNDNPPQC